jgi:hypothetical protein
MVSNSNPQDDGIEQLKTTRRRYLQGGAGAMVGLGSFEGWEGSSIEAVDADDTLGHIDGNFTEFAPEATPLDLTSEEYVTRLGYRKRRTMVEVLRHPEVNDIVSDMYGTFDAFDSWIDHDALGLNGCRDFTVEEGGRAGVEQGEHTIQTIDNRYIRALVDPGRSIDGDSPGWEDRVTHLSITEPKGYTIKRRYGEAEQRIIEATLDKDPVQELLGDADEWYVGIGKVTSISTYSPQYPKTEITFPVFVLPREHDYLVVDTGIEVENWPDDPQAGDLVYAQAVHSIDAEDVETNQYGVKPKGRVTEPAHMLAEEYAVVDDSYPSADQLPDPPAEKVPWLFRGNGHYSPQVKAETPNPTERDNWSVEWTDSSTDGMISTIEYDGTQAFERAALSVSLTAYPPHTSDRGQYSKDIFVEPRAREEGNVMFHDNLGLTGPGVLGVADLPTLDKDWAPNDRPEGFKFRTHYHTGANAVPEFHSGLRYGPYNYVVDWHFFEDGQMVGTYQRNGPGYETGHGIPVYSSMWAFVPTPGGAEQPEVHWFDGQWNQVTEESEFFSDGTNMLRVKNPNSDDVIDFELNQEDEVYVLRYHDDEMGVAPRIKDAEREEQFYHPSQYMDGESIDGERVVVWVNQTTHGETVPFESGSVPFVNMVNVNVGTADGWSGTSAQNVQSQNEVSGGSSGGSDSDSGENNAQANAPGMGLLTGAAGALGAGAWLKRRGGDSEEE